MIRFNILLTVVAWVIAGGANGTQADDRSQNRSNAESPSELQIVEAYPIGDLAVWREVDGRSVFDASLLIAYLTKCVAVPTQITSDGEHKVLEVAASRSGHKAVRRAMIPLWAFSGNAAKRLQQKLNDARAEHQKVLVVVAHPNSATVEQFFDLKSSNEKRIEAIIDNYLVQCVSSEPSDVLTRLGITPPNHHNAIFAVLNFEGIVAAHISREELEVGGKFFADGLCEFLDRLRPEFPDARSELATAFEQAARQEKRVLVQLGGSQCGPCIELTHFLDSQGEPIDKDYIRLKLDSRMSHAAEVMAGIRPESSSRTIPWMAILTADQKILATSDGPQGNIAFPRSVEGKEHFEKMLRTTCQRLTNAEITTIVTALDAH